MGKLSYMGGFNAGSPGHVVFLKDNTTGALFLANTSASVSLVTGPASPHGCLLTAANGVAITIGPERSLILRVGHPFFSKEWNCSGYEMQVSNKSASICIY